MFMFYRHTYTSIYTQNLKERPIDLAEQGSEMELVFRSSCNGSSVARPNQPCRRVSQGEHIFHSQETSCRSTKRFDLERSFFASRRIFTSD